MGWEKIVIFLWVVIGVGIWFAIFAGSGWTNGGFIAANLVVSCINLIVALIFIIASAVYTRRLR